MFRYSLASLLLLVVFVSVGAAALKNASDVWREIVFTGAVAVLLFAALAAIAWRGPGRWFARGFAVAGWVYFLLACVFAEQTSERLVTERMNVWLYVAMHGDNQPRPTPDGYLVVAVGGGDEFTVMRQNSNLMEVMSRDEVARKGYLPFVYRVPRVDLARFSDIAHALLSIALAICGGAVAQCLASRSKPARQGDS